MATRLAGVSLAAMAVPARAPAAEARRESAGTLPDGRAVKAIVLSNRHGIRARILTYGATLQSLVAPDRHGRLADILIGYDDVADYVRHPRYFGATVGRYANRIAGAQFALDGRNYRLDHNDGANTLHGGPDGFNARIWTISTATSGTVARAIFTLVSPDGDQGFPGNLDVTATFALDEHDALTITYAASTDRATVVNITNHAIFNLAGEGAPGGVERQLLTIPASAFLPVTGDLIPTGERRAVAGTPFDFRRARAIGSMIRDGRDPQIFAARGYDHNFAIDKGVTAAPGLVARLTDPGSGRRLDVLSTEPGLQVASGNTLNGQVPGKNGHLYRMGDGIALEPQKFPNAPNEPGFASARLDPGRRYRHVMIYRLSAQ